MIKVVRGKSVVDAYIFEGFRRLYSASIDSNGNYVDYDTLYANAPRDSHGRICLPFDDIYCHHRLQNKIIDDITKEPYMYLGYKTVHRLKQTQRDSIRFNLTLGPSPNSSLESFIRKFTNIKDLFTPEEIEDSKKF
jgi:hypothetical protein